MLLTPAVLQLLTVYSLVIKTKSDSISAMQKMQDKQRLVTSTSIAQCNHLTVHLIALHADPPMLHWWHYLLPATTSLTWTRNIYWEMNSQNYLSYISKLWTHFMVIMSLWQWVDWGNIV